MQRQDTLQGRVIGKSNNFMAVRPNAVRRIIGRRQIRTQANEIGARQFAVETDFHDTTGLQKVSQDSPTYHRLAHVMQHAAAIDHVETARVAVEREYVAA